MNRALRAQRQVKLKCKTEGTPITLRWEELSDDPPAIDPTTGARLAADDPTSSPATEKICVTKVFVHFVQPIKSEYRKFAEMQAGDAIVDMVFDLYRITDAGDSAMVAVGDVVDELALNAANRAIADGDDLVIGSSVDVSQLKNVNAEFGGRLWVQKEIGEDLAKNWDTIYSSVNINRALLLRLQ